MICIEGEGFQSHPKVKINREGFTTLLLERSNAFSASTAQLTVHNLISFLMAFLVKILGVKKKTDIDVVTIPLFAWFDTYQLVVGDF